MEVLQGDNVIYILKHRADTRSAPTICEFVSVGGHNNPPIKFAENQVYK